MNGTQEQAQPVTQQAPPYPQQPPQPPAAPAAVRANDPRRKSPLLACILSLMPGLGQIYVGYYQRGFVHAFVVAGMFFILSVLSERSPLFPTAVVFLMFFWLYNIIDAGRRASLYNQLLVGTESVELPEDIAAMLESGPAHQPIQELANGPKNVKIVVAILASNGCHLPPYRLRRGGGCRFPTGLLGVERILGMVVAEHQSTFGPAGRHDMVSFCSENRLNGFPITEESLWNQPPQLDVVGRDVVFETLD